MSDLHDGHRERLKNRFKITGFEGFAPHEALELMLFYCIPRRDTNKIAHDLIDTFGGFDKVLEADIESLQEVDGIGENSAIMLRLYLEAFKLYNVSKRDVVSIATSARAIENYAKTLFVGANEERCYLICFNANNKHITTVKVSEGTVDSAEINARRVAELATRHKAVSVILAHNHPGGVAMPSASDLAVTKKLYRILHELGIRLTDHVIVSDEAATSLAAAGIIYGLKCELGY